jgi:hypothetical protein
VRDKIQKDSTEFVVACFSRGRLFSEHKAVKGARKMLDKHPCLDLDDYCIYSPQEWNDESAFPTV